MQQQLTKIQPIATPLNHYQQNEQLQDIVRTKTAQNPVSFPTVSPGAVLFRLSL